MGAHLIYGANGFTGELTAREAHRRGQKPILAGRREGPVRALAEELGLEWRIASLGTPKEVDTLLDGVDVVLHCAGPFPQHRPMVDAPSDPNTIWTSPVRWGVSGGFSRNDEAKAAGVVLIPGAGFDGSNRLHGSNAPRETAERNPLGIGICCLEVSVGDAQDLGGGNGTRRVGSQEPKLFQLQGTDPLDSSRETLARDGDSMGRCVHRLRIQRFPISRCVKSIGCGLGSTNV